MIAMSRYSRRQEQPSTRNFHYYLSHFPLSTRIPTAIHTRVSSILPRDIPQYRCHMQNASAPVLERVEHVVGCMMCACGASAIGEVLDVEVGHLERHKTRVRGLGNLVA
jgi:hypothetical protein